MLFLVGWYKHFETLVETKHWTSEMQFSPNDNLAEKNANKKSWLRLDVLNISFNKFLMLLYEITVVVMSFTVLSYIVCAYSSFSFLTWTNSYRYKKKTEQTFLNNKKAWQSDLWTLKYVYILNVNIHYWTATNVRLFFLLLNCFKLKLFEFILILERFKCKISKDAINTRILNSYLFLLKKWQSMWTTQIMI